MNLHDFTFQLPDELIAQKPASPRDSCKLMVLDRSKGTVEDRVFYELKDLLKPGDVLVLNNSKVLPARILFEHKGKQVELFLVRQIEDNTWLAIGKPGKVLVPGQNFKLDEDLSFFVKEVLDDGQRVVQFSLSGEEFSKRLEKIGVPPFPPYIKNPEASFEDYQTIYADNVGSVAAPTAGLHFTDELLNSLKKNGVQIEFVTLHVGLGTFQPVKTQIIEEHRMHEEFFHLASDAADRIFKAKKAGGRVIAVGTTSVRVLESTFDPVSGFNTDLTRTNIFIYPGYKWKIVDGIITNFHLPQSTLLLLVCAFAGKDFVLKAYERAISAKYRFYSFGDAMLII